MYVHCTGIYVYIFMNMIKIQLVCEKSDVLRWALAAAFNCCLALAPYCHPCLLTKAATEFIHKSQVKSLSNA